MHDNGSITLGLRVRCKVKQINKKLARLGNQLQSLLGIIRTFLLLSTNEVFYVLQEKQGDKQEMDHIFMQPKLDILYFFDKLSFNVELWDIGVLTQLKRIWLFQTGVSMTTHIYYVNYLRIWYFLAVCLLKNLCISHQCVFI